MAVATWGNGEYTQSTGGTMLGGTGNSGQAASNSSGMAGSVAPIMGIIGAISQGLGAYQSAKSTKMNLEFQRDMAVINARMAENTAQSIMEQGKQAIGQVGMKARKVKGAQKVSQASRGLAMGEGSTAEEIATTDLMKETDMITINANTVRAAMAARTQSVNATNESLLKGTTADSISPFSAASTSFMNSATSVASSWYRNNKLDRLATQLGV